MSMRYDDVLEPLRQAYDARAAWRDGLTKEPWKLAERQAFRDRLAPGARLLEIGAGTGQDSAYFQQEGLDVVAGPTDDDTHEPPRFFSWRTDERLLDVAAAARFDVVDFHRVDPGDGYHVQSLTLRRPDRD